MSRRSLWVGTNIADRYCITGEIGGGGMGRVYSAIPFADPSQTVAIKLIERSQLDHEDVLRFQREAALMSRLRHPHIIAFHELGLYQPTRADGDTGVSGYYIVMEIAQGQDLKEALARGGRKSLDFFFEIGLQVSSALEYTHAKNIIHRDIKPQNVIIERAVETPNGLLLKVLDFGIARLTELELYGEDDPNHQDIAGTPLYMAPENSKYLDAPNDHRADLYSLGCMLYEVLAGRPPFLGTTREQLARDHAQAIPEALLQIRPDIPVIINDLVMKLIAKHPNDRYQTAFGLHVDLQRIRKLLRGAATRSLAFVLGQYDKLNIMPSTISMVGREAEFESLVSNYNAIAKGNSRSRMALIRGGPGSGKTRLLKEFRAYLAKHRIRYVSTSFSRHENNLPFNALANGFNEYLVHALKTQPLEAEEIRRKVRTMLGATADLVAQIVQGLKPYLDEPHADERVRTSLDQEGKFSFPAFAKAFSDFTRCLASEDEPIAFFFDDMQWADAKSLQLIDSFFSHNNSQRFFLVMACQSLTGGANEDLRVFVQKFSKLRRRYRQVELSVLDQGAVCRLSQSILGLQQSVQPQFVQYLETKGGGNPLYILELHKSLVTQEFLNLNASGMWEFNMDELVRAPMRSNSIDLIYNRLNEVPELLRQVLEIAAVIGGTFEISALQAVEGLDSELVQQAVQYGLSSGLTIPHLEQSSGASPTGTYSFVHRSIREALLDPLPAIRWRELHRKVAEAIEGRTLNPKAQAIFTLAHHFFQALAGGGEPPEGVLKKALYYNMKAGAKALDVQSPLTAQRYYENARSLLPRFSDDPNQALVYKKQILHALADILFAQRNHLESMRIYKELRALPLSQEEYAFVAHKLVTLSLASGHVAASLREVHRAFQDLRYPPIRIGVLPNLHTLWTVLCCLLTPLAWSLPLRILRRSERREGKEGRLSFHPFLLYFLGQSAGFNFDRRLGVVYHAALLREAAKVSLPEDVVLRLLCDHAAIVAYLGFPVRAYRLLEIVHRYARERHSLLIQAYAIFIQTLIVDPYSGRQEDVSYNLERMQADLDAQELRIAAMQELVFRIFIYFTQAQAKELTRLIKGLPSMLAMRHWLTSRAVAIYLFWLMLVDSRDLIVSYRGFMIKRAQQSQRRQDIFLSLIETIIAYAAGDREASREAYLRVLSQVSDRHRDPLLMPHELDFLLVFVGFYPEVFAFEYGEDLWAMTDARVSLRKILPLTQHRHHSGRAIPILLGARISEYRRRGDTKQKYDKALKQAKLSQQHLIILLCEMGLGRLLIREQAIKRIDYLNKGHQNARALGLHLLVAMIQQIAKELGSPIHQDSSETASTEKQHPVSLVEDILWCHLELIPQFQTETLGLKRAQQQLFAVLRDHLECQGMYLITSDDMKAFASQGRAPADKWEQLIAYVSPYLNLRSSLTIPLGDAPWLQDAPELAELGNEIQVPPRKATPVREAEDIESTLLLSLIEEAAPRSDSSSVLARDFESFKVRSMNTLVPLRYGSIGLGILFLERSRLEAGDSTLLRQLLDTLGAQIGIWLRSYVTIEPMVSLPQLCFHPGAYHLEPCSWLDIWSEGMLPDASESVWYLGVNLSEQAYLLTYCHISGPSDSRRRLSSGLWHGLLTLRTLSSGLGREQLQADDIQAAVERLLRNFEGIQGLASLALAFSIIQRSRGEVISGHFGAARPVVLDVPNEVTPLNRAVLQFGNGRYLRYWKVEASQLQRSVLLQLHDASAFDRLNLASLREQGFELMSGEEKRIAFREYLQQNLIPRAMPRYFVAASWLVAASTGPATFEKAG